MNVLQALVLGVIQGLTEFIPVSSSGHLILGHYFLGTTQSGLAFDVVLNIGTLLALVVYFRTDIIQLVRDLFAGGDQARLPLAIIVACIPAVILGVLLQSYAEDTFRSPILVTVNMAIFGVVMIVVDKFYADKKTEGIESIGFKKALKIGMFQALALVPGVSRSGSTITGGVLLGLDRTSAARFSFLMSLPITFGAVVKVLASDGLGVFTANPLAVFVAILAAFVSGILAIRFLLNFLTKKGLAIFGWYRLGLAAVMVIILLMFGRL